MDSGRVHLRAFIEGVEVPIIKCTTEESIWRPSSATLQLPYHRLGKKIIERSVVHVFCSDPTKGTFIRSESVEGGNVLGTFEALAINESGFAASDPRRYRLMFCGETRGDGRFRNSASAQLSITAIGFSNYFDHIKQYQATRGSGSFSDEERRFAGVEDAFTSSSGRYATPDRIVNILRQTDGDLQSGIRDLLTEFISRTNWFWKDRFTLLRFQDLFRAIENDDTAEELMDMREFKKFVRNTIGSGGVQMTIRGILMALSQFLFHDLVEHAAPSYFSFVSSDALNSLSSSEYDETSRVVAREDQVDKLTSIVYKPELWWTSPPTCNILFPEQYSAESGSVDKLQSPTRTVLKIRPGVSGSRRTIADRYFAPDVASLNSLVSSVPESEQHVVLLPHERFRGINTNFVFLSEISRLTRRDSAQNYLRSYAQFQHWKTSYESNQITIDSSRLLPQVLVGYPAVAIDPASAKSDWAADPNLEEKIRLRRLLSLLYACLSRWERELSRLRAELALARQQFNYLDWLLWVGTSASNSLYIMPARSTQHWLYENGRSVSKSIQGMLQEHYEGTSWWNPQYDADALLRFLGEEGRRIIPEPPDATISLDPSPANNDRTNGYVGYILRMRDRLNAHISHLLGLIAAAEEKITRLGEGIAWVNARLRELGWDVGQHEHILFYVAQKVMEVRNDTESPGARTTITGTFARAHDEDIDLDGIRGDSFEQVIKTGPGGFFSDMYAPDQIGQDIYWPLYGVDSLVSLGAQLGGEASSDAPPAATADIGAEEQRWHDLVLEICGSREDESAITGLTVKEALGAITDTYRDMISSGEDPSKFVDAATARPIATMFDMFGASTLDQTAQEEYGNYRGSGKPAGVGFHEFTFLQGNNEADNGETFDTTGLEGGESDQLDIATARRRRVIEYVQALENEIQSGS